MIRFISPPADAPFRRRCSRLRRCAPAASSFVTSQRRPHLSHAIEIDRIFRRRTRKNRRAGACPPPKRRRPLAMRRRECASADEQGGGAKPAGGKPPPYGAIGTTDRNDRRFAASAISKDVTNDESGGTS